MNKKKGERPPRGFRCDFCQINEPKHTINGGAWWICQGCFDLEYGHGIRVGPVGEEE